MRTWVVLWLSDYLNLSSLLGGRHLAIFSPFTEKHTRTTYSPWGILIFLLMATGTECLVFARHHMATPTLQMRKLNHKKQQLRPHPRPHKTLYKAPSKSCSTQFTPPGTRDEEKKNHKDQKEKTTSYWGPHSWDFAFLTSLNQAALVHSSFVGKRFKCLSCIRHNDPIEFSVLKRGHS